MGLKLTVGKRDKVLLSCGVVVDVLSCSDKQTCLEFTAPADIEINTVFADSEKQFKNLQKAAARKNPDGLDVLFERLNQLTNRTYLEDTDPEIVQDDCDDLLKAFERELGGVK